MPAAHIMRPDGATIHFETKGRGRPVLLIAPGGMRSSVQVWESMPWNPWNSLPTDKFLLIAMDQRNASRSRGPVGQGWSTYVEDQLAVLDYLGIERCLAVGSCIGPSYIFALMQHAPSRVAAAVLMQPIGLAEHSTEPEPWEGTNRPQTDSWFNDWAFVMEKNGRADRASLDLLQRRMFGAAVGGEDHSDFVFSVRRNFVQGLTTPLLVLMGMDFYHPSATSREIAALAPNVELVENWRGGHEQDLAGERVADFLLTNGIESRL